MNLRGETTNQRQAERMNDDKPTLIPIWAYRTLIVLLVLWIIVLLIRAFAYGTSFARITEWSFGGLALLFLIGIKLHSRHFKKINDRVNAGLCPACGYDLRATPDRCPECGREVERVSREAEM